RCSLSLRYFERSCLLLATFDDGIDGPACAARIADNQRVKIDGCNIARMRCGQASERHGRMRYSIKVDGRLAAYTGQNRRDAKCVQLGDNVILRKRVSQHNEVAQGFYIFAAIADHYHGTK